MNKEKINFSLFGLDRFIPRDDGKKEKEKAKSGT